jgi:hypothetical protein
MWNMSAGHVHRNVIRADVPDRAEYVTVAMPDGARPEVSLAVAERNLLWKAAHELIRQSSRRAAITGSSSRRVT